MKLRILGCGTSSGVPRIGNDWGACDPAEPRNRRTRSSILLGDSARWRLLVDCGPDLREQLLAAGVAQVDALVVTHDHADHCHGIDDVRQIVHATGRPLPLYARAEVLTLLEKKFSYAFAGTDFYSPIIDPQVLGPALVSGMLSLSFVDQPHGNIYSLGIRVESAGRSLAYAIDYHDMNAAMADLYGGVDLWVSDCLRRTPHPTHAHLDLVLGWARELRVGQLLLTHLDKSMDYATLVAELPDWAAPAFDGQEVELC